MRQFDIIFVRGRGVFGKLIRFFTNEQFSHVALVIDDFHVLETDWKYPVGMRHLKYRSSEYEIKRCSESLSDEQKTEIIQFYKRELKRGYDWKYLLYRFLFIFFKVKIQNDKYRYTCDEIILEAYKCAGISLLDDDVMLTPGSLSKSKYLFQVD